MTNSCERCGCLDAVEYVRGLGERVWLCERCLRLVFRRVIAMVSRDAFGQAMAYEPSLRIVRGMTAKRKQLELMRTKKKFAQLESRAGRE